MEYIIKVKLLERMTTYIQYMGKMLTLVQHMNYIVKEWLLKIDNLSLDSFLVTLNIVIVYVFTHLLHILGMSN